MTYAPAVHRRSGYQFTLPAIPRSPGIFGLTPRQEHVLCTFVRVQPPRVLAELLLEIAAKQLDLVGMLALVEQWQQVPPAHIQAAGGHRMPPLAIREVPR